MRTGDSEGQFCLSCELLHCVCQCHCLLTEAHRHKARPLSHVSIRSVLRDWLRNAEILYIF